MQALTAFVLAGFAGYIGAWYFGAIEGNFALLLLMATIVTGLYWLAERFYFLPRRHQAVAAMEAQNRQRREELDKRGIVTVDSEFATAREKLLMQPWWLDWTAGLFPVIAIVFLLRSFLFEPFKIPSGSMIPTLHIGDLILVNKFHYGIRLPVINTKITEGNKVERGDVMVFRYPPKPSLDYIKRVVGVPGDEVAYLNKQLTINGQAVGMKAVPEFFDADTMRYARQFEEQLGSATHRVLVDDDRPAFIAGADQFPFRDHCRYSIEGVVCKVPAGHYFVLGDNRDRSYDSRFWGFVNNAELKGLAFIKYWSWDSDRFMPRFGRIGRWID